VISEGCESFVEESELSANLSVVGRLRGSATRRPDAAAPAREAGFATVRAHPLFGPLLRRARPHTVDTWGIRKTALARGGLLAIDAHGGLLYDATATAEVGDWIWSLAHVLTHLGFGHADPQHLDGRGSYTAEWRTACCVVVDRFLGAVQIRAPQALPSGLDDDEEGLARRFASRGIPGGLATGGPAGGGPDLWEDLFSSVRSRPSPAPSTWGRTFAIGLAAFEGVPAGDVGDACIPGNQAVAAICATSVGEEARMIEAPASPPPLDLAIRFDHG